METIKLRDEFIKLARSLNYSKEVISALNADVEATKRRININSRRESFDKDFGLKKIAGYEKEKAVLQSNFIDYVDDEKAFKKCRKKWDEEMIIGIDGVQWIPENVGEIVAFTDEINEVLARLDRDEDVGTESYGLFCNMDEFFSAQIYADNEEHCFKVVAVQSVV